MIDVEVVLMNGRFGYLYKGKFHLIYSGDLLDVDTYTMSHYKNRKDLFEKEEIPEKSTVVLYCTNKNNKRIYNRSGYALQSTVMYGKDNSFELDYIMSNLREYAYTYSCLTLSLEERFCELEQVSFPGTIAGVYFSIKKDPSNFSKYYYVIKQASLEYLKAEREYLKAMESKEKELDITVKPPQKTTSKQALVREYLQDCQANLDYEEFWNHASLDDLIVEVKPKSKVKKRSGKNC